MQLLILTVFTLILGGAIALLAVTFLNDGSRIIEALSGHGVAASGGNRKKQVYRVTFLNFAERETSFDGAEYMRKSSADRSIRLIVSNDGDANACGTVLGGPKPVRFSPRMVRAPRDRLAA